VTSADRLRQRSRSVAGQVLPVIAVRHSGERSTIEPYRRSRCPARRDGTVPVLGLPFAGTAAGLATPRCDLARPEGMGRVHHRTWLAGDDRSVPAVWTARVGGQVARLDPLESAACAFIELAQPRVFNAIAHEPTVEQAFGIC
jgi:hypothetical protein